MVLIFFGDDLTRMFLTSLIFFFFLSISFSIAIISPVFYLATLSLGAVVANGLVSIAVFLASECVLSKKIFGVRPYVAVDFLLRSFGKSLLFLVAIILAALIFNPLTLAEAVVSALFAACLSASVLAVFNYKDFNLLEAVEKKKRLFSIALFCAFVFVFGTASILFAVQMQPILSSSAISAGTDNIFSSPFFDFSDGLGMLPIPSSKVELEFVDDSNGALVFYDKAEYYCLVRFSDPNGGFIVNPPCILLKDSMERIGLCPLLLNPPDLAIDYLCEDYWMRFSLRSLQRVGDING